MARLFLIAVLLAVIVAMVVFLVTILNAAVEAGQKATRPFFGKDQGGLMAPSAFQKVAYVALVIVLFGVSVGWLGGL